ncbi:MAG: sugar ABC transporter ATP-binding protein [Gemmatimonadaceae bacterium]|jgi:ribose transport system ATP-binding protein|nr:sugar ABC transporter ATP-binding protein [Gemmatimonadaceae bacterium]
MTTPAAAVPALEMRGVRKRYPGTIAVDGVDLVVRRGEVHALLGENGAGKSTLMKMLAGSFSDYEGTILVDGRAVTLHSPAQARAHGIQMIHQELNLAPTQTVAENLLAGRLPRRFGVLVDGAALAREARTLLERVGCTVDPATPVERISQLDAQLVEIAKALGNGPSILVMDEPTSALGRDDVARLFAIIDRLRDDGLSVIYISHHLPEIFEIADTVTVLRDGKRVATAPIDAVTPQSLVAMMVGGAVSALQAHRRAAPGAALLEVRGLTRRGFFADASFTVRAGEIVGLCGLGGAGRSELLRAICGADPVDAGEVRVQGATVRCRSLADAIAARIAYVPEDRKTQGLALRLPVGDNVLGTTITAHARGGWYARGRGAPLADALVRRLQVNPPDLSRAVGSFSGGNQQKVLLAKWLAIEPAVFLLDEPTRGVDIAAKVAIHETIAQVADAGAAVVLVSSDLPELLALASRILVMRRGRIIGELARDGATEETLLLAANGELPSAA